MCNKSIIFTINLIIDKLKFRIIEGGFMRLILALLLPWLQFFTIGRPFAGIFCLILQITLIGWIPAAIWSVYALSQYNTDKKIEKMSRGG